ncbi:MAG TPA: hypothetical protein VG347_20910 [Verrucomicrobiae bacterium]|nr:hypothetical protein [Verrucomicrobiae bacterium]
MKTRKLNQIKPNKTSEVYDLGRAIDESEVRSEFEEGLNDFVRAKASAFTWLRRDGARKQSRSKRFASGEGGRRDAGITGAFMPQGARCAGKQCRSATMSTLTGQVLAAVYSGIPCKSD